MEREFQEIRWPLARRYGVDNGLNRVVTRTVDDWIGIAACGHTFHEVREALRVLGFATDDDLRAAGVRLFQLLMPVPLDPAQAREFADGPRRGRRRRGEEPDARRSPEGGVLRRHAPSAGRGPTRRARRAAGPGSRHARRRHVARSAARPTVGPTRRPAPPTRRTDHARSAPASRSRSTGRRSTVRAAHTTAAPVPNRARSSAAASAATRWWR